MSHWIPAFAGMSGCGGTTHSVMAGRSRSQNGVLQKAYDAAIHVLAAKLERAAIWPRAGSGFDCERISLFYRTSVTLSRIIFFNGMP
jgi:hypothetical protein